MKWVIEKDPIAFQVKTIVGLILFAITTTSTFVGLYYTMNNRIDNHVTSCQYVIEDVNEQWRRLSLVETSTNKIETDLAWIKATLVVIQQTLEKK